jgi:hypothetical protein
MYPQAIPSIDPTTTREVAPDPFDLAALSLGQDFAETAGVKRLLKTIPVRRLNPQDFIRTHPDPDYRRDFRVVELKEDRELFLVRPEIASELEGELAFRTLYTAVSRQGVVFFWPVVIPPPDAKNNEWWRSAREAAELATTRWIRMKSNLSLGAYEMFEAGGQIPDPQWPDIEFRELLRIAFRDRLIDRVDHPVIRRLRGLA